MYLNNITIAGNLVREPRHGVKNDRAWLSLSIALNKKIRNAAGEWVDAPARFWDIVAHGHIATNALANINATLASTGKKSVRLLVVGSIDYSTNEKDGRTYQNVFIQADDITVSALFGNNGTSNGTGTMSDDEIADLGSATAAPAKVSRYDDDEL
jgi:single-stranded DNA-binding protein